MPAPVAPLSCFRNALRSGRGGRRAVVPHRLLERLDDDRVELRAGVGAQLLERLGGALREIGDIVRACHERWDGKGYPDGTAGDAIPLIARIVCCCDAFNAMTTDRPYRRALTLAVAVEELEKNSGTQFDPAVVEAFEQAVRDHRSAA